MIRRYLQLSLVIAAVCSFTLAGLAQQAAIVGTGTASAAPATSTVVPRLVNYSGVLTNSSRKPLAAVVGVTFFLYKDEQGGAPLWLETQNVKPDATGHYTVRLGSASAHGLPAEMFMTGEARWLALQIGSEVEQPRVLLVAVPYAMKASDAETLGGLPASAFMLAAPVSSASPASATGADSTAGQAAAPPPAAVTGSGTLNFLPLWTGTATVGNSIAFQSGTGATAKLGINTTTPTTTLDIKGAGTVRGVLSLPAIGAATAAAGKSSQPLSLVASAFNSTTAAATSEVFNWQAEPTGNNTATPGATMNLLFGVGATKPAETGLKIANNGLVTFATGQTFPGVGTITGVTAGSGLTGGGTNGNITLSLPTTCAANQILKWSGSTWACSADAGGSGTITGVTAGTALTGGGTTGRVTLNIDTTKIPQLVAANAFTGNQSVIGNISSNGTVSGSIVNSLNGFYLSGSPFVYGSQNTANAFFGLGGNLTMTGGDNVAAGSASFVNNTSGNLNTAYGVGTLKSNTTGSTNSALGTFALGSNTTGSSNTAIGNNALTNITTGSNNTALGSNAGPDTSHGTLTNATAIGANALVSASNALILGGTGANAVSVGIGTATPAATLDVHGTANFTGPITFAPGQTFPGLGTVTSVGSGAGLTGGPITGAGSLSIANAGVTNAMLQNPAITINASTGLTGGGSVALGGSTTLGINPAVVPALASANIFSNAQMIAISSSGPALTLNNIGSGGELDVTTNSTTGIAAVASGSFQGWSAYDQQFPLVGVTAIGVSGVYAQNDNSATGVQAVYGLETGQNGVVYGVRGLNENNPFGAGVFGGMSTTPSTIGLAWANDGAGLWGDGGFQNHKGVLGTADDSNAGFFFNNSPGAYTLFAYNANSTGYSFGAFNQATGKGCLIDSGGNFSCSGAKNAVVSIDGGQRKVALAAIESPKNWFEDFGSEHLLNGAALIQLEPDFAQTVNTQQEYHVFLTASGDCKGLYVSHKTATSFEVRELGGGTSGVSFDYRIVALRKDYESVRLADHTNDPKPPKLSRNQKPEPDLMKRVVPLRPRSAVHPAVQSSALQPAN